jgi:hypothetical protein
MIIRMNSICFGRSTDAVSDLCSVHARRAGYSLGELPKLGYISFVHEHMHALTHIRERVDCSCLLNDR